jgi:integrase
MIDNLERQENRPLIRKSNGQSYLGKDNKDRFFFPKEYMGFEDVLKSKQKFSVRFLINTGSRIMEAQNVKVEDCDLENKRITLRITKTKATKGEKHGKTRIIPISSQFAKYLKKYITDNNLAQDNYLGILSNNALNTAYKIAGKKSGMKDYWNISSHTFRKTLEVWLMALGVDSLPLTAHIGHDIKTAAQYYVSPDIFSWEDKTKMREVIGDLYQR